MPSWRLSTAARRANLLDVDVTPFLTFTGAAEEAMTFYAGTVNDAEIVRLERFGPDEAGPEGGVKFGPLRLGSNFVRCFDSADVHAFGFTPAISLFVDCDTADQVDRLSSVLR